MPPESKENANEPRCYRRPDHGHVKREGIALVDWWATWCGPCRAFAPVYAKLAERYPDIVFGKVDTEAEGGLASAFQIRAIPTVMVFRDGVFLLLQAGVLPERALEALIERVRAVDMRKVRREIENMQAAPQRERRGPGEPQGGHRPLLRCRR